MVASSDLSAALQQQRDLQSVGSDEAVMVARSPRPASVSASASGPRSSSAKQMAVLPSSGAVVAEMASLLANDVSKRDSSEVRRQNNGLGESREDTSISISSEHVDVGSEHHGGGGGDDDNCDVGSSSADSIETVANSCDGIVLVDTGKSPTNVPTSTSDTTLPKQDEPRLRSESSVFLTSSRSTLDTKPSMLSSGGSIKSSSSGSGSSTDKRQLGLQSHNGTYRPLAVKGFTSTRYKDTVPVGLSSIADDIQIDLLPSLSIDTVNDSIFEKQDGLLSHSPHRHLSSSMDTNDSHNNNNRNLPPSDSHRNKTYILNTQRILSDNNDEDNENLTLTVGASDTLGSYDSVEQDDIDEAEGDGDDELREFLDFITCGKADCSNGAGGCDCTLCDGTAKFDIGQDEKESSNADENGAVGWMIDGLLGYFGRCGACVDGDDIDAETENCTIGERSILDEAGGSRTTDRDDDGDDVKGRKLTNIRTPKVTTIEVLHRHSLKLISQGRYDKFTQICRAAPSVLTYRDPIHGMSTVVHVLCRSEKVPTEVLAFQALSLDASSVAIPDQDGNLPLHILTSKWRGQSSSSSSSSGGSKLGLLNVLLKIFAGATAIQNEDGELPIHLLLDSMAYGKDLIDEDVATAAVVKLLEANPKSVGVAEDIMQRAPIHIALTRGPECSLGVTNAILEKHKQRKISIARLDYDGNSPLHLALKHRAPYEALQAIICDKNDIFLDLYLQPDSNGDLPIHTCLKHPRSVDGRLSLALARASPFTATCPDGDGLMPIQLAISSNADAGLIKALLEADLPIEIRRDVTAMPCNASGTIAERQHGNSWWHIAVEGQDRHIDLIDQVMSSLGLAERIGLSKSIGPDGTTTTRQAAPPQLAALFHRYLGFLDRYTLVGETKVGKGIISSKAIDHGLDGSDADLPSSVSALVYEGGFSEIQGRRMSTDSDGNEAFEIALAPTNKRKHDGNDAREASLVSLRCYEHKEVYMDEINARKTLETVHSTPSTAFVEAILDSFEGPDSSLHCLAFEHQTHTLEGLLQEPENASGVCWLSECREMFGQIGRALRYMHRANLVHGNLNPSCLGLFADGWKLMYVGQATTVGCSIGGSFRRYAPPEHVASVEADPGMSIRIQTIPARPSFDLFSLGQIMARVFLDHSAVLPVFEEEDVACAKKKLAQFGRSSLSILSQEMVEQGVGDLAVDLIMRLLEPCPSERLGGMSKALSHRYFHDDLALPVVINDEQREIEEEEEGMPKDRPKLESCPSTVGTDVVVSNLDALTLELRDMSFDPKDDQQSQAPSSVAPSIAQSAITTRITNSHRHSQSRLNPPPPPPPLPLVKKTMITSTASPCIDTSNQENAGDETNMDNSIPLVDGDAKHNNGGHSGEISSRP